MNENLVHRPSSSQCEDLPSMVYDAESTGAQKKCSETYDSQCSINLLDFITHMHWYKTRIWLDICFRKSLVILTTTKKRNKAKSLSTLEPLMFLIWCFVEFSRVLLFVVSLIRVHHVSMRVYFYIWLMWSNWLLHRCRNSISLVRWNTWTPYISNPSRYLADRPSTSLCVFQLNQTLPILRWPTKKFLLKNSTSRRNKQRF